MFVHPLFPVFEPHFLKWVIFVRRRPCVCDTFRFESPPLRGKKKSNLVPTTTIEFQNVKNDARQKQYSSCFLRRRRRPAGDFGVSAALSAEHCHALPHATASMRDQRRRYMKNARLEPRRDGRGKSQLQRSPLTSSASMVAALGHEGRCESGPQCDVHSGDIVGEQRAWKAFALIPLTILSRPRGGQHWETRVGGMRQQVCPRPVV